MAEKNSSVGFHEDDKDKYLRSLKEYNVVEKLIVFVVEFNKPLY